MSANLIIEILLGVLLTVSALVTVAVLWPGRPQHRSRPRTSSASVRRPPRHRPRMTGGSHLGASG
ncbi:hypothetical protein [Planomonospora venezuelensis]|uniref:Uncharacterized protein n=1 Tax=Planomonospora venezuelensis TaxID=1999 RepID=A0A841DGN0_PLAVE|nr:hypothetical protein [Planomonospora venezuelensis]MBB5967458.1 hypothetical protein [Planomonospora venezuelensis]GIN04167.1 hypothetical protein Pve01_58250 [Planomonospora venezuelensis]